MNFSDLRTGSGPGVSVIEEFECTNADVSGRSQNTVKIVKQF